MASFTRRALSSASFLASPSSSPVSPNGFHPGTLLLPVISSRETAHVHDEGSAGNRSYASEPFSRGLMGVAQGLNWAFIYTTIAFLLFLFTAVLVARGWHIFESHLRLMSTMGASSTRQPAKSHRSQRYWSVNHGSWWPRLKRNLVYAPLWKNRHNREFQLSKAISNGTLPGRFHSLLLFTYFGSQIGYCLALDWRDPNPAAVLADLRGRSGSLAAINLIPLILFALRNNPFIWLLGVSYDTFNLLHRWIARLVALLSLVHTICWAVNTFDAGGMAHLRRVLETSASYSWGMVGTALFLLIVIVAWSPIRHAFYETFINLHRLFALGALLGVYFHLDRANLPQLPFLQLAFALWGLEWLIRLGRIFWHSISLRRGGCSTVTVEAMNNDACRVTFETVRPFHAAPGSHAHIYIPRINLRSGTPWASHPFSVAHVQHLTRTNQPYQPPDFPSNEPLDLEHGGSSGPPSYRSNSSASVSRDLKFNGMPLSPATSTSSNGSPARFPGWLQDPPTKSRVSFVCRARTGFTKQLYDTAKAAPSRTLQLTGLLEGPYGGTHQLESYGTVLLFAAGVGITHQLPYLSALLNAAAAGSASTRKIVLIWTVPTLECLEWIQPWMDSILSLPARRDVLKVQLFITRPKNVKETISPTRSVMLFPGRPNIQQILDTEVNERTGAMAVTVCGPGVFADGVRSCVRKRVHWACVDFVEEAFTY